MQEITVPPNGRPSRSTIRFGLCCLFAAQPIKFRQTTAQALAPLPREQQLERLSAICQHNLQQVSQAMRYLVEQGIGAFRLMSPLFPRHSQPQVGYALADLPEIEAIYHQCQAIRHFQGQHDLRLSLHPDQFNVLASPHPQVVANTLRELECQGELAELLGVEVINIHVGGAYGDKQAAMGRLQTNFPRLSTRVRSRLTLENDDVSYTPADVLPLCRQLGIPFVYDVHHHRCLPDGLSCERATEEWLALWQALGREPYGHLSSPKHGWASAKPRPHADYIDPADFPDPWRGQAITVDLEAKAKELAVRRLMTELMPQSAF